jgi:hypothetical protein
MFNAHYHVQLEIVCSRHQTDDGLSQVVAEHAKAVADLHAAHDAQRVAHTAAEQQWAVKHAAQVIYTSSASR